MFCKDCGAQLSAGGRFCPHCGRAQDTEPATFVDKVRYTGKKVGGSPAFLIATICFTLTLILHLVSLLPVSNSSAYGHLLETYSIDMVQLETIALVVGIVCMIPSLLTAIGLWITYGSCASRKPKANTAGLAIIFVVNLVLMVVSCLALLASLLPCFYIYGRAQDAYTQAVALGVGLAVLAAFAFALIYYISLCTTISNIRNTLKTGIPSKKASWFVAIVYYIGGALFIVSGISNLFSMGAIYLDSYYGEVLYYLSPSAVLISAASSLLTAAALIIFGALIFSYRSKMAALETEARLNTFQTLTHAEPYTSPVYIPPQPAAEPQITEEVPAMEESIVIEEPQVAIDPATDE